MPWTSKDATHSTKKAKSKGAKRQWSTVANKVRTEGMKSGMSEGAASGKAKRIANAAVAKRGK